MSHDEIRISPQNVAVTQPEEVRIMEQWRETGMVPVDYAKKVLGDPFLSISSVSAGATGSTRETTPSGRRIRSEGEMARMKCPFPPNEDL